MGNQGLRNIRVRALIYGGLMGIAFIAFVYAFVQRTEVDRQKEIAEQMTQKAEACEQQSSEREQQLERINKELMQRTEQLRLALVDAQVARSTKQSSKR